MKSAAHLANTSAVVLCVLLTTSFSSAKEPASVEDRAFEELLASHKDLSAQEFLSRIPKPDYRKGLSFDPTKAKYFDAVSEGLKLNAEELEILRRNGFVSVDHGKPYSFGSAYYAIYTRDLPVLITTDSILHAMHKSYDEVMMEMETRIFVPMIREVLNQARERLFSNYRGIHARALRDNYHDLDLYLTVALELLKGSGAAPKSPGAVRPGEVELGIGTRLGEGDAKLREILATIRSLRLQTFDDPTSIYGGRRPIDFSQFKPRGHYNKTPALRTYFQTMMWLGRADTGFILFPPDPQSGLKIDSDRELRNAALLTRLLYQSGGDGALESMNQAIEFLVGKSDNLTVFAMNKLLVDGLRVTDILALASDEKLEDVRLALESGRHGTQRIRSQVIASDPSTSAKVAPPALFQLFGQRFILDSFLLSHMVYDSIIFEGKKMKRGMPTSLDVAAALGNDHVLPLIEGELKRWNYSANLQAARVFVWQQTPDFWTSNLYNIWLDSLRQLPKRPARSSEVHFPETMQTNAWQMKQLQTQLASWAELRRDTILYAKQSYTSSILCDYPHAYVEPYPEVYRRIQYFAATAAEKLTELNFSGLKVLHIAPTPPKETKKGEARPPQPSPADLMVILQNRQVSFFKKMAGVVGKLEQLARKELAAEPFTEDEVKFLKKTIDRRGGGSGPPRYDGWYCDLLYARHASTT